MLNRSNVTPVLAFCALAVLSQPMTAQTTLYSNGFEIDTAGWNGVSRVPTGTSGITSSAGSFHAVAAPTATSYTTWGGYNFGAGNAVPTAFQEYWTSVDIYLDVGAGLANGTRFDWSSAINNSAGTHLRDFIFNAGFYSDTDSSPGSGTNRFVVSASNNSQPGSAFAKNPANSPIAISTTGWYTFDHHFYSNSGVLAVDMRILNASDVVVGAWTLSNPADAIGGVGGNRYGWVDYSQAPLALDNSELRVNSVPDSGSTLALLGISLLGMAGLSRRYRR